MESVSFPLLKHHTKSIVRSLIAFKFACEGRKLVLPSIAALPLLMAYAGHTTIMIPKPLVQYIGTEILDLGNCGVVIV